MMPIDNQQKSFLVISRHLSTTSPEWIFEKFNSGLRMKFYANWIEFIIKQTLYPDHMNEFRNVSDIQFWFRLVRVGVRRN